MAKHEGLTKRGDIWHIQTTVRVGQATKRLRESTGCGTLSDARGILGRRIGEIRAELQRGVLGPERTWSEAAAEYIADMERRGKDSARSLLDVRMLIPQIGQLPLSHVHQRALQGWIDAQRGKRAAGTVRRSLATCTAILNHAARVLRDGNRPWLAHAVPKLVAPDWGSIAPYRLSWEEQDRLTEALPAHLLAPVLFALSTGARQAEITSLTWEQERQVAGLPRYAVWWIPPEVRKGSARKGASEQEGRYLIANQMARSVLMSVKRDHGPVFPSSKGADIHMYRINNRGWRAALKRAGLTLRVHDLRHTFGERLATAGVDLTTRKSLLGHDHQDITEHYSRPGLSRLVSEAERVTRDVQILRAVACQ